MIPQERLELPREWLVANQTKGSRVPELSGKESGTKEFAGPCLKGFPTGFQSKREFTSPLLVSTSSYNPI